MCLRMDGTSANKRVVFLTLEFLNEGLLKVPSSELLRDRSLPVCRSHLILKSSGKFRLISIPTSFNARFRQAGGLVDFLRFLRDQVATAVFTCVYGSIPNWFDLQSFKPYWDVCIHSLCPAK